ncbi:MAG: hypothetical protein P1V18_03750 [Candidatus Gracilibacteria bacterium]|nr:hypothetical protein [Candidatus Gracilibacteria bacterium]
MPLALFLISVIVSGSMFVTLDRVSRDTVMNQALVASTAAFYTASSSAEVTWSQVKAEDSTDIVDVFKKASTDTNEGDAGPREYLTKVDYGSDDYDVDPTSMEFNQGRVAGARFTGVKIAEQSFVDTYVQSSAEVFMYQVPPDRKTNYIHVDYCETDEACPELIVDWFVLQDGFQFQELAEIKDEPSEKNSIINPCLDYTNLKIKRCVLKTDQVAPVLGDFKQGTSVRSGFQKYLELKTVFPANHYLFRFRTVDRSSVRFKIVGRNNGGESDTLDLPLATAFFEVDELGNAGLSFRRVRQQQMVSGGLQDGLEFVHFAETVEEK